MTRVCGAGSVFVRGAQIKGRIGFEMGIFRLLRRMHCNSILAILATARLAEIDWEATDVEWIPFDYEQSKFIFIRAVSGVTRTRADETEVAEGGHNKIRKI